jgi:UDP-galactopyranose mutase
MLLSPICVGAQSYHYPLIAGLFKQEITSEMPVTRDWIVVGAGFTGTTFAERMATAGKRVLVVERRQHFGGNAYDGVNERGILVHRYGPHIFHTNSDVVWRYLSKFTDWRPYEHRVLGLIEDKLVPIPFNLDSLAALFSDREAARIQDALIAEYGLGKNVPILRLRESKHGEIRDFADYVYRNVFEGYTIKQWQLRPEQLSPSVTARVPVSISHDDRYFRDTYQSMPLHGYTAMFRRMLSHPNIEIALDCDWKSSSFRGDGTRVLFTGAIDELLDYRFGPLAYRSLRFEECTIEEMQHQAVGTINYPNNFAYTRITEQKIITGQQSSVTTLVTEYPQPHEPGKTIAYYPIPRDENQLLYAKYAAAAQAGLPHVCFAGRLADYQYYNMDQACARALKLASEEGGPAWH